MTSDHRRSLSEDVWTDRDRTPYRGDLHYRGDLQTRTVTNQERTERRSLMMSSVCRDKISSHVSVN